MSSKYEPISYESCTPSVQEVAKILVHFVDFQPHFVDFQPLACSLLLVASAAAITFNLKLVLNDLLGFLRLGEGLNKKASSKLVRLGVEFSAILYTSGV